ncbi:MAG: ABC transporter permease [Armatimonadota bacterium]|nr:ABC transporter permease [Armatimonadota bacterium]MDR5689589.1 ABC transporter permease [Armatimonadota bacterium]MDR7388288.1 ABC transporter permease [Armatimonadota bacterium]MDR7391026.1 ABC transporter permease [Armatimonadota bacterium]MDR7393089.1 ABC transporter permease [Armatimonadota bacterium]
MWRYVLKRVLLALPVLLGVSVVVFVAIRLIPGDPAQIMAGQAATEEVVRQIRQSLGLDQPLPVQYLYFLRNVVRGDLGRSLFNGAPVVEELGQRFPRTVRLALASIVVASLIGVPAGILAATRHLSWLDTLVMLVALVGVSMPVFWLGLNLILVFSVRLQWLPAFGYETWRHLLLPSVTLGAASAAIVARMTRSSMLEVLGQDYIRTARAKGLAERVVVNRHALRNALIPVVTVLGLQLGTLLSGAVLTETVFAWPGIGRLLVDAVLARDYPIIQGATLLIAATFVALNLAVDLLYGLLDPRIRYE